MNQPTTNIEPPRWTTTQTSRLEPNEVLTAQARTSLDENEWHVVRRGIGLMPWSLCSFLICMVGTLLTGWCRWEDEPVGFLFNFLFFAGLPIGSAGFLAGVVLSLI